MTTQTTTPKIKLSDIDITTLSNDAIQLLSKVSLHIGKLSGKRVRLTDPQLLEKISYKYKRIDDPAVTDLYKQFKQAMKQSLVQNSAGLAAA